MATATGAWRPLPYSSCTLKKMVSASTSPQSGSRSGLTVTARSLRSQFRPVFSATPSTREICAADTPVLCTATSKSARNQSQSSFLVFSKTVPVVRLVCVPQSRHSRRQWRDRIRQGVATEPQRSQTKPSGYFWEKRYASHWASEEKRRSNERVVDGKLSKFKAGSNQDALILPSPATQPDAANGATINGDV